MSSFDDVKAGFVNYMGVVISSYSKQIEDGDLVKHNTVGTVMEMISDICVDKDKNLNVFASKPVFKLTINFLILIIKDLTKIREKLEDEVQIEIVNKRIKEYESAIETLKTIADAKRKEDN